MMKNDKGEKWRKRHRLVALGKAADIMEKVQGKRE
jgi:hypothetical protein